jgi:hypothetical protein
MLIAGSDCPAWAKKWLNHAGFTHAPLFRRRAPGHTQVSGVARALGVAWEGWHRARRLPLLIVVAESDNESRFSNEHWGT